jgi:hypothetical protein
VDAETDRRCRLQTSYLCQLVSVALGADFVLDESPSQDASKRTPCPRCRSTARHFEASVTSNVRVTASIAWEKVHEEVERNLSWFLGSLALTVAGAGLGFVFGGVLGLVVGLLLGLLGFLVGLRGETRVREIERGGGR